MVRKEFGPIDEEGLSRKAARLSGAKAIVSPIRPAGMRRTWMHKFIDMRRSRTVPRWMMSE